MDEFEVATCGNKVKILFNNKLDGNIWTKSEYLSFEITMDVFVISDVDTRVFELKIGFKLTIWFYKK